MTKICRTIASTIVILAGSSFLGNQTAISAETLSDSELAEFASTMNQSAPVMVDEQTRFEKASVADGVLSYHYTMVNYRANEINTEKFEETISKPVKAEMCSNAEMKNLLQQGASVKHSYQGNDKVMIGELTVDPKHCGF